MNKHIKGLLPIDEYHAKVVQCEDDEGEVRIVWKVDRESYAYRTLIEKYPTDDYGLASLARMGERLNFTLFPQDHPEFYAQFLGVRAKLHVTVDIVGRVKKNVILQHSLPELPEDYNVAKPKTDSFYYHTNSKRKLPI